jgi:hypothetical protein
MFLVASKSIPLYSGREASDDDVSNNIGGNSDEISYLSMKLMKNVLSLEIVHSLQLIKTTTNSTTPTFWLRNVLSVYHVLYAAFH